MTDTFYNVPQGKASRLAAAQQRSGARMDGAWCCSRRSRS